MLWTLEINFELLRIKRKLSFYVAAKMKYEKTLSRSTKKSSAIFLQIIHKRRFLMKKYRCALKAEYYEVRTIQIWPLNTTAPAKPCMQIICRMMMTHLDFLGTFYGLGQDWGRRTTQYFETVVIKYYFRVPPVASYSIFLISYYFVSAIGCTRRYHFCEWNQPEW